MKQQAIDILEKLKEEYKNIGRSPMGLSYLCADEIEALEEAKSRIQALGDGWIPVTERLPEKDGVYFIYDKWNQRCIDTFDIGKGWFLNEGFDNITHWQPLPLPPVTK